MDFQTTLFRFSPGSRESSTFSLRGPAPSSILTPHSVEGSLVDIAASVPLLRPLLSRLKDTGSRATKNTYELRDYSNQNSGKCQVYGKYSNSRTVQTTQTCNTGSEESILPLKGSIVEVKQTSHVVEFDVEKQAARV